jgi:hypothetical protein
MHQGLQQLEQARQVRCIRTRCFVCVVHHARYALSKAHAQPAYQQGGGAGGPRGPSPTLGSGWDGRRRGSA